MSHSAFTGLSRAHLGELIEELVAPWSARREGRLHERRQGERRRAAGAGRRHELVFVDRVLVTLAHLRLEGSARRRAPRLQERRPAPADVPDPADATQRELLRGYVDAFEAHDVDRLIGLLADDVRSGMPPFLWWLHGPASIGAAMTAGADACAKDRLLPGATAGGCLTLGQYRPDPDGVLRPFALLLLELRGNRVAEIVTFLGWGERFTEFGLPQEPETLSS